MPLSLASISAKLFQLFPNPLLTEYQLKLLKYDNILTGKYKNNFDIGSPSKRYFDHLRWGFRINWWGIRAKE